jgi:hypothetical protein
MTGAEKKLARALKDAEVTGLSNSDVRLIKIRIAVLSEMVAREHDQQISELTAEVERLRRRLAEVEAKPTGDPEIQAALAKYNAEKNGGL